MIKYVKLCYYLFYYSLLSRLEYRMDFIANIIRSLTTIVIGYIGFSVIFQNTDRLVGWTKNEALVLFGIFLFINELWKVLFFLNIGKLPAYIQKGDLDGLLLKPVSIQFLISLRYSLVFAIPNVLVSILIIGYYNNAILNPMEYIIAIMLIINGIMLLYSLTLLFVSISFWTIRLQAFMDFYHSIIEGARYPVTIFDGAIRLFFTFIIPIAIIFTFPAQFLTKELPVESILLSFGLNAIFFFVSHKVFYLGIKRYNSASS